MKSIFGKKHLKTEDRVKKFVQATVDRRPNQQLKPRQSWQASCRQLWPHDKHVAVRRLLLQRATKTLGPHRPSIVSGFLEALWHLGSHMSLQNFATYIIPVHILSTQHFCFQQFHQNPFIRVGTIVYGAQHCSRLLQSSTRKNSRSMQEFIGTTSKFQS